MSIPFFKNSTCVLKNQREDSFIYPCTGSGHKNTLRLLLAWEALYNQGYQPALHLTISYEWPNLIAKISALNHKGLKIINHGTLAQKELLKLYSRTKYMIYPSLAESFGLPLIEAAKSGCKIIASDLPFTYAVVHPSLTFNPYDVKSIKEAIITCLQKEVPPSKCIINDEIQSLLSLVS